MKLKRLFTCIVATIIAFLLGFSSLACLTTAFDLPLVDLGLLAMYCMLTALLCGLCCSFRLGLIPLGLLALGAGYLWQSGVLIDGLESLLFKLTKTYNDGYGWGILQWSTRTPEEMGRTLAPIIYILGVVLTALTAWTVCKGWSSIVVCLSAAVPVLVCFVVTDTLPDTVWLGCFFFCMLLMILTSTTRRSDPVQGGKLMLMAAIPAFLAVGLLFLAIPQEGYHRQAQAQALCDKYFGESPLDRLWHNITGEITAVGSGIDNSTVDLSKVGIRLRSQSEVLQVNARYTGTLYLRGRALDDYTGTAWQNSHRNPEALYWPDAEKLTPVGEVTISTRYAHRMLYLPYYVSSIDLQEVAWGVENTQRLSDYSFTCSILPVNPALLTDNQPLTTLQQLRLESATQLPEDVVNWAKPLVNSILGDQTDPYQQAQLIGNYVRSSARYDLQTRQMPRRYYDFAQWFLEESQTGYCVHFATAAAVLLKAAGIPARYATGYMVQVEDGMTTVVRSDDAHAWVEYWLPGFGWTVLECTPPAQDAPVPETTVPSTQPEATTPETQPQTTPTQPQNQTQTAPPPQNGDAALTPGQDPMQLPGWLLPLALWLAGVASAVALTVGQWKLRLRLRSRARHRGSYNQQIVAHWVALVRLSRPLGHMPQKELFELAQMAKFSQYTLTEQELSLFDAALDSCRQQLRRRNLFRRLWDRLVLALY